MEKKKGGKGEEAEREEKLAEILAKLDKDEVVDWTAKTGNYWTEVISMEELTH